VPLDLPLGPFYVAAAIVAGVLSRVVRKCEGRPTWLALLLRLLAIGLAFRFGWLLGLSLDTVLGGPL